MSPDPSAAHEPSGDGDVARARIAADGKPCSPPLGYSSVMSGWARTPAPVFTPGELPAERRGIRDARCWRAADYSCGVRGGADHGEDDGPPLGQSGCLSVCGDGVLSGSSGSRSDRTPPGAAGGPDAADGPIGVMGTVGPSATGTTGSTTLPAMCQRGTACSVRSGAKKSATYTPTYIAPASNGPSGDQRSVAIRPIRTPAAAKRAAGTSRSRVLTEVAFA